MRRIHRVYIREVTSSLPDFPQEQTASCGFTASYSEGHWFYVEIHVRNFSWYGPIALGVVQEQDGHAELMALQVLDDQRRQGYGRIIVEQAGKRWPGIGLTPTNISMPFHERLVDKGIVSFDDDDKRHCTFISKENRQQFTPNLTCRDKICAVTDEIGYLTWYIPHGTGWRSLNLCDAKLSLIAKLGQEEAEEAIRQAAQCPDREPPVDGN